MSNKDLVTAFTYCFLCSAISAILGMSISALSIQGESPSHPWVIGVGFPSVILFLIFIGWVNNIKD